VSRTLVLLCCLVPACSMAQVPPALPPAAPTPAAPAVKADGGWIRIKAPGADELWYDREKLVLAGGEVTFWRRVNFALPQAFRGLQVSTALYREQINCDDHTMRVHAHVFRTADGTIVEQANHAAAESAAIVPDTLGDILWRTLCPIANGQRAAEDRLKTMQERLDNRRRELERLRVEVEELDASVTRLRAESRDPARDVVREPARDSPRQPGRQGL
jgi:hypothetical protein